MEAFAFSIAAFLELSAEPFAVCFLIEWNAVLLPSVEFQRELLAVARLALWGVPYCNHIFAIFEEAGYVDGSVQKNAVLDTIEFQASRYVSLIDIEFVVASACYIHKGLGGALVHDITLAEPYLRRIVGQGIGYPVGTELLCLGAQYPKYRNDESCYVSHWITFVLFFNVLSFTLIDNYSLLLYRYR